MERPNFIEQAQRETIANIGQLTDADKRELDKLVKRGVIAKWRGAWFPITGAPFGLAPFKTCYGPTESKAYWDGFAARNDAPAQV